MTAPAANSGGHAATTQRGLWLSFLPPFGLEVAQRAATIDWIGVDLQHGDLALTDLAPLARVAQIPVYARSASHDPAELSRIIDCGVAGVIVPSVDSAAQATALAAAVRTPPLGRRSSGFARASVVGAAPPVLFTMVETAAGLAAADQIAAVAGVDGLFVGPYDLSLSLGEESVTSPTVVAAIIDVVTQARRHDKLAAVFAGNADLVDLLPPLDLLGVHTDAMALQLGLAQLFPAEVHT